MRLVGAATRGHCSSTAAEARQQHKFLTPIETMKNSDTFNWKLGFFLGRGVYYPRLRDNGATVKLWKKFKLVSLAHPATAAPTVG